MHIALFISVFLLLLLYLRSRALPLLSKSFTVFALLLLAALSAAQPSLPVGGETLATLAADEQWRDLLHFTGNKSFVDDRKFFLSDEGYSNPQAELAATLQALKKDADIQCRFPARTLWLRNHVPALAIAAADCAEYRQWRQRVNAHSVVLVLASSYLNSPSSMYGHTFLRFDPEQQGEGVSLMSYAVNFGALVDKNDNGMFYAFKGLVGGYPGYFSDGPYYEKVKEYSRLDNRDIWEYQLNLTPAEVDFMLAHLWELKNIRFDYYFFDENCSFRLLELLEVARPGTRLIDGFDFYAIPVDTVAAVEHAGMIDSVYYRASNKSRLQFNIDALTVQEQQLALQLADNAALLDAAAYQSLPEARRYKVVETAYQYLRFKVNRRQRSAEVAQLSLTLLKEMQQHADYAEAAELPVPPRPEQGHDTAMLDIQYGLEDELEFSEVQLRASYHDLLDNLTAYPPAVSLNIGKLGVRVREHDDAKLQFLDLIEITSLSPRDDFFHPLSWQVKAGLERQWLAGDDELVTQVSGGAGWTTALWGELNGFALLQARLEYNRVFKHGLDIAGGASMGLLLQQQEGSFMLEARQYRFTDGEERRQLQLAYQLPLARNHGLRFIFRRQLLNDFAYNEQSLSYRLYF